MLSLVVTKSKARLLGHRNSSVSLSMSASLIYSQNPTEDLKSNHKRWNTPSIHGINTLGLVRTVSNFRGIHSSICSVMHSRCLSSGRHSGNIEDTLVIKYAINCLRVRIFLKTLKKPK